MNLDELFEDSSNLKDTSGMYNISDDKRVMSLNDTRKPKLTLLQINKLRRYYEFRRRQEDKKAEIAQVVYKAESSEPKM